MVEVMTVTGPVDAARLGTVLFHEHLVNDGASAWRRPAPAEEAAWRLVDQPVTVGIREQLRVDPYVNKDNCSLDDLDLTVAELAAFSAAGGRTIVEQTVDGIGRNPAALRDISGRSGVQVVMGAGYYLERSHPPYVATAGVEELASRIAADVLEGVDGVRAGLIGEIGVGPTFTDNEHKVLRASARAQVRTRVPMSVHLPGWERLGLEVIDVVAREGADPRHVVLSHINPASEDQDYLVALAETGCWLSFDMLGMDHEFPGEGASPTDEQAAVTIARLLADGYGQQVLLSHDVFIKTLLTRYGGPGYAHVLTDFLPRLTRHGVPADTASALLSDNPRRVFEMAAEGEPA